MCVIITPDVNENDKVEMSPFLTAFWLLHNQLWAVISFKNNTLFTSCTLTFQKQI